ncbi:hypothetical protein GLOTRDRAFT_137707 [Gloeophyllum trabeum ATCC 11539]|uniref:Letm1 RBD domain-containing protein n=1 Tax=Gloeophyllum trabeum (strain ATCC 11539 / FP-39264 / Madison 617) TaxID=670483 RepID=S7QBM6_GLOTA|nr:uncharacterized protein GLOTRDRAFT_137707 [Gloeophyllum trabeum ATCC 11539]EPQ57366.1 hypothetical protein GLOTRDRAFT_137707 [Gloeophyllum trabeum ATCC 11539]
MIRSFARNGLVERSITATKRSSGIWGPAYTPYILCHGTGRQAYPADAIVTSFVRAASTTSSSTGKPSSSSSEAVQSLQKSRKPKVDLKPAPVKPTKLTSTSPPSTSLSGPTPADKAALSVKVAKDESQAALATAQAALKQAEEAKTRDIEEAIKHGILAPPPPGAGTIRRGIHNVWEFMKFYARGMRMVMKNSKRTKEMLNRVAEGGHPLSRWETRFIQTYRQDIKRLVPFLLIVLIIEEIVPLIALYAPGMLPSTCILPSQQQRIAQKRRERLQAAVDVNQDVLRTLRQLAGERGVVPLGELDSYSLSVLSTILNASPLIPITPLRRRKIAKRLTMISEDDSLLIKEDYGSRLTEVEVVEALEERGLVASGMKPSDQSKLLTWWLKNVVDTDPKEAVPRRVALVGLGSLWRTGQ